MGSERATARNRGIYWLATAAALVVAVVGFLALADMIQFVVHFPHEFTFAVWAWRGPLIALFGVALLVSLYFGLAWRAAPRWVVIGLSLVAVGLFVGGFVNPPYLMFRSQQHGAAYISAAEALEELDGAEEVSVIIVGDDAAAFPYRWINQPHIAGANVGGEDVVLTWCGLSHLGLGFKTRLPAEGMASCNLKVMTQLENNLVMFDAETGEPIQQIYGELRNSGRPLDRVPTVMMTLGTFAELYPDGRVFYAPITNPWDGLTRAMMFDATEQNYDRSNPDFAFPTLKHFDERAPRKEQVYGIVIDGQALAYTRDYIREQGGVVLAEHGGTEFTVKDFLQYDVVDVFHGHVPEVSIHGRVGEERVDRLPHASRVLWTIWANYFRDTWLNGAPPAGENT